MRSVVLSLMGAIVLSLLGCGDEPPEASRFAAEAAEGVPESAPCAHRDRRSALGDV